MIKYLGVMLKSNNKSKLHINKRKRAAYGSTGILNKYMDLRSVIKLFSIYMRPILSYGMETMTMNGDELGYTGSIVVWDISTTRPSTICLK